MIEMKGRDIYNDRKSEIKRMHWQRYRPQAIYMTAVYIGSSF
jgi:hypothetical protein